MGQLCEDMLVSLGSSWYHAGRHPIKLGGTGQNHSRDIAL